jgi:hypothetical protein
MTRTRSRSRTRSASAEPHTPKKPELINLTSQPQALAFAVKSDAVVPTSTTASTTSAKRTRLHQGTVNLKAYLNKANRIFGTLPEPLEQKVEIEFIASFIKGMSDEKDRKILIEELQQEHQSRTKKDGRIEILCQWNDVGDVMENTGLLEKRKVGSRPNEKLQKGRISRNELKSLLN